VTVCGDIAYCMAHLTTSFSFCLIDHNYSAVPKVNFCELLQQALVGSLFKEVGQTALTNNAHTVLNHRSHAYAHMTHKSTEY